MFTAEIFNLILKRSSWAIKSDIANFVNKTDFDSKLKYVTSNKNKLNELWKNDLIDKFSILNEAKYFF